MVKLLGIDGQMANADVLEWMKTTRERHAREDAEDRAAGIEPTPRPKNFLAALDKHERHLMSDSYPYAKNPSVYDGRENIMKSKQMLNDTHFERIHQPIFEKFKEQIQQKLIDKEEGADKMEEEQLKRDLTNEELLVVYNHAPTTVEQLTPMLEDAEQRYTPEELQVFVDVIKEVLRKDELAAKKEIVVHDLKEAISDIDAVPSRAAPAGGESIDDSGPLTAPLSFRPVAKDGAKWATGANAVPAADAATTTTTTTTSPPDGEGGE